jgi:DinB superfamily
MTEVPDVRSVIVGQTRTAWRLVNRNLDGLTADEYSWEPAPGCWSLRRKSDLVTPLPADAPPGDWMFDSASPDPVPAPLTTIAWLVAHMMLGTWNWRDVIAGRTVAPEPELAAESDAAVAQLRGVLDSFSDMVEGLDSEALIEAVPVWGTEVPRWELVTHVHHELVHHAAEIGRMRHLFATTARPT